jgi:hypothetical protein
MGPKKEKCDCCAEMTDRFVLLAAFGFVTPKAGAFFTAGDGKGWFVCVDCIYPYMELLVLEQELEEARRDS